MTLSLSCVIMEEPMPDPEDKMIYYFGPGVHDLPRTCLSINTPSSVVYLAGGTVMAQRWCSDGAVLVQ